MVNYKKCYAVAGFNTKQLWVYDEGNDRYIDPPSRVLDEIDAVTDTWEWDKKEELLNTIIESDPDWLQDEEYSYDAEEYDI